MFSELITRIEKLRDRPARADEYERFSLALTEMKLDFPSRGRGVILIAGTNGKGSVAKTLETLLGELNPTVGLFSSPHMMKTTERIRSFGSDLSEDEFVQTFTQVEPLVEKYGLGHFQILTLMMAEIFFSGRIRPRVDWAVIEVGVGGRLDPTRAIPHATAVITRLGIDHVELLGGTLHSIAQEKFAIAQGADLLVHAPVPPEAQAVLNETKQLFKNLRIVEATPLSFHVKANSPPTWVIESESGHAPLALMGARAAENTSIALQTLSELGFSITELLPRLCEVRWPCRMEGFRVSGRRVYFSGDHNLQGIESLREILTHFQYQRLQLLAGFTSQKDASAMMRELRALPRAKLNLTLTPFRASDVTAYSGAENFEADSQAALRKVLSESLPEDLVIITGSLYLAGYLRKLMFEGSFGEFTEIESSNHKSDDVL